MSKRNTIPLNEVNETLDQLSVDQKETNRKAQKIRAIQAAERFRQAKVEKPIQFPLQAFPAPIRVAIQHWVDVTNLSVEHFGTAVLAATSVALGNKIKVRIRENWDVPAIGYYMILGSSGVGKTPIWNFALQPILDIEKELHATYYDTLLAHKEKIKMMVDQGDDVIIEEPRAKKLRVEKIATETLLEQMWSNPHGLFLFRDELRSWFMSLNQGSGRDDVELFLEFWNNSSKVKDLKSTSFYIERTSLTILGGLQPDLMKDMATGTNIANGLFQRFLCGYPYKQTVNLQLSEKQADPQICDLYNETIRCIYNIEDYLEAPANRTSKPCFRPMIIPMSKKCYEVWHKYYAEVGEMIIAEENDNVISTIRKHDQHVARIALLLRMLRYADEHLNDTEPKEAEWIEGNVVVEKEDMQNAVLLSRYYLYQSRRILDAVQSPVHGLKPHYQMWYHSLEDSFTRKDAVEVRDDLKDEYKIKLSNGTLAKLLNDRQLFRKRPGSNGHYDKLWEI